MTSRRQPDLQGAAERYLRDRRVDPLLTGVQEYRALRYVWMLNDHGYLPTIDEATAYFEQPDRAPASTEPARWFQDLRVAIAGPMFSGPKKPAESVLDYVFRLHWIDEKEGDPVRLLVTTLGRTVCRAVEAQRSAEADDHALVLDPDDPFVYARFADRLGTLEDVLLVDPYFRLQQLIELHPSKSVRRVLIGDKVSEADRASLVRALPGIPQIDEVRVTTEAHDRFLIPAAGDVLQFGVSVNGIGRSVSVLAPLRGETAATLRRLHEEMWAQATLLASQAQDEDAEAE